MKKLDILLLHFKSAEVSHYKLQVGSGPSVLYLDNTISISALNKIKHTYNQLNHKNSNEGADADFSRGECKFGNVQSINEAV